MGEKFDENAYEQALISLFQELGYEYDCGYEFQRKHAEQP